jgi:hypothetical protein
MADPDAAARAEAAENEELHTLPLSELRRRLAAAGWDCSGFLEKSEFVDALRATKAAGVGVVFAGPAGAGGGGGGGPAPVRIAGPAPLLRHFQDAADLDDLVEVMEVGDPRINAQVRNDQLVALTDKAMEPGAKLRISEHMWRLLPKRVDTPAGIFTYLGIAAAVDLPKGFTLANNVLVPVQADNLPEEKSFQVFAFDEALCLGFTEEDGVTPR